MNTEKLCKDLLTYHFTQGHEVGITFYIAA